jgi:hypothetical protein
LNAGDVLLPGNKIQSPGARYLLTYQTDGNFVVYGSSDDVQWSSGTNSVGSKLVLQNDGNLVIYDAAGGAVWATNTQR